jgi:hypothetical protein
VFRRHRLCGGWRLGSKEKDTDDVWLFNTGFRILPNCLIRLSPYTYMYEGTVTVANPRSLLEGRCKCLVSSPDVNVTDVSRIYITNPLSTSMGSAVEDKHPNGASLHRQLISSDAVGRDQHTYDNDDLRQLQSVIPTSWPFLRGSNETQSGATAYPAQRGRLMWLHGSQLSFINIHGI